VQSTRPFRPRLNVWRWNRRRRTAGTEKALRSSRFLVAGIRAACIRGSKLSCRPCLLRASENYLMSNRSTEFRTVFDINAAGVSCLCWSRLVASSVIVVDGQQGGSSMRGRGTGRGGAGVRAVTGTRSASSAASAVNCSSTSSTSASHLLATRCRPLASRRAASTADDITPKRSNPDAPLATRFSTLPASFVVLVAWGPIYKISYDSLMIILR